MPIQLAFQDERLRGLCESPLSAKRKLGPVAGRSLHTRLADLRAAESPIELVDLGFAQIDPAAEDRIVIHIDDGYLLVAASNHRAAPFAAGKLDWTQVTRVKILSIDRSHEN